MEFARQRKRAAKQLGVAAADIDAELEARRDDKILAPLYGHWIVEPWPEPVEGDSLLRDIVRRLRRHVVCAHDDALAIALWVMFSWVHRIRGGAQPDPQHQQRPAGERQEHRL